MARWISTLGDVIESPVTLPAVTLPDTSEAELREAHQSFAEKRVIRAGRDCWEALSKAESFESWKKIGAALALGKTISLKITGANQASGRLYSHYFSGWMKANGFGSMRKSDRSVAIELSENLEAIEQWRATLPERQRKRLKAAQSNVKAWRKDTETARESPVPRLFQLVWETEKSLRHFISSLEALPPSQAQQFKQKAMQCVASIGSPSTSSSPAPS